MKNLISLFLLLFTFNSNAITAKFLHFKGEVKLNGKAVENKNVPIEKPYRISTGDKSLAVVKIGETVLKINENSKMNLTGMFSGTQTAELNEGSVFSFIKKQVSEQQRKAFTLKAKDVAMGVRGTTFFASLGKKDDVWMCVNEGIVGVVNKTQKNETIVKAGEGVVAKKDKKVSEPKPLKWTKKLNWKYDPKDGELDNKVSIQEAYVDLLDVDYD